jgi:hypothetical protein
MIKRFQMKKANKKYRINNRDRVNMIQNKSSKKYYYNTPGLREKLSHFRKLRYQMDEDYKKQRDMLALNYYHLHKEEVLRKAKERYQLMKNKATNKLELNNNVIQSF